MGAPTASSAAASTPMSPALAESVPAVRPASGPAGVGPVDSAAPGTLPESPLLKAVTTALALKSGNVTLPAPAQTRILCVANQKGGVGKTTTAVNIAAALAYGGLRVLLIDLDPQGNASTAFSVEHHTGTAGSYEVVVDQTPIADVVCETAIPGLTCVPATLDLAGAETELVSAVAREQRLRRAVAAYAEHCEQAGARLDYIIIDCPPSLGLLTLNALTAAHEVLLPIQCEFYALEGVSQLLRIVELVSRELNPGLKVGQVLLTMFDARTRLSQQVAEDVRAHFGGQVLSAVVPRSVRVSEAPSFGQTVIEYDPGSSGSQAYIEAARELAERLAG